MLKKSIVSGTCAVFNVEEEEDLDDVLLKILHSWSMTRQIISPRCLVHDVLFSLQNVAQLSMAGVSGISNSCYKFLTLILIIGFVSSKRVISFTCTSDGWSNQINCLSVKFEFNGYSWTLKCFCHGNLLKCSCKTSILEPHRCCASLRHALITIK